MRPSFRAPPTTRRPFCWLRSSTVTLPPMAASRLLIASPIPEPPPATSATLPAYRLGTMSASATAEVPFLRRCRSGSRRASIRRQGSRRGTRYLRYGRLLLRSLRGVSGTGPRIVENVRGLQADEAAVSTGEGECFGPSVDRLASDDMLERDPFVPALPLLVAAERAAHARLPALEEIEDALHPNHARPGRCRRFPIPSSHLIGGPVRSFVGLGRLPGFRRRCGRFQWGAPGSRARSGIL